MSRSLIWKRNAQLVVALLSTALVKFYYSTASVNELRWILGPTTAMVEVISGTQFDFESHSGYMSQDHTFLIAASCAGVNFLITAFLLLSLRRLWRDRTKQIKWSFLAAMALIAYAATIVANTARISIALQLRKTPVNLGMSPDQLHRFEGIFVYFGFLLVLFLISERLSQARMDVIDEAPGVITDSYGLGVLLQCLFPLLIYYAITLGVPLANGAY